MSSVKHTSNMHTCAICKHHCTQEEIPYHSCLEAFSQIYIDSNFRIFYPVLENGFVVGKDLKLNNTENVNSNLLETNSTPIIRDLNLDDLISAVKSRRPLWDNSLPVQQRNRTAILRLWDEVSADLNGVLTAEEARLRFRNLRDTYRKIIQAEQYADESETTKSKKRWKHYKLMDFLRDNMCPIQSLGANTSRISTASSNEDSYANVFVEVSAFEDQNSFGSASSTSISGKKPESSKKRRISSVEPSEESSSAISRIADAMARDEPAIVFPALPKLDEVESILHAVGLQLQRMPYKTRMDILVDIMNMVHAKCKNN